MNKIVVDAHLHIYPFYDIGKYVKTLMSNLNGISKKVSFSGSSDKPLVKIGLLAERYDCNFYKDLTADKDNFFGDFSLKVESTKEKKALKISNDTGDSLFLIAGRQIVTKEKIEVLALGTIELIEDGMPFREVLNKIKESGGINALPWAPGKWFFERGEIIDEVISNDTDFKGIIVDSALRPYWWKEPYLMKKAKNKNIPVLHGSDPLPFMGEEGNAGIYASVLNGNFDVEMPLQSLNDLLMRNEGIIGKHKGDCFLKPVARILQNYMNRV